MRIFALLLGMALAARAETYTLTLKQAVDRALSQNPEVLMARMDELKATLGISYAKSPFTPRLDVGTGAAYTNGFPLSIEGSAPAIFQAKTNEFIFNRAQTYAIRQARESARGSGFALGEKNDEITFRVASLYIDLDRAARLDGDGAEGGRKPREGFADRAGESRRGPRTSRDRAGGER